MPITKFKSPHLLAISEINIRILWAGLRSHSELNRKLSNLESKMEAFIACFESTLSNEN